MKDPRNALWARWAFYSTLTFLPFILAVAMFALRVGFIRWIWIVSLGVAFFSFFRAQRIIAQMRGLKADKEFDRWLQAARRRAIAGKSREEIAKANIDRRLRASQVRGQKATDFGRPKTWRTADERRLQHLLHDLFSVLGLDVKNVAAHKGFGAGLQVEGKTYIVIAGNGKRATRGEIKKLEEFVSSSTSWRYPMAVSPSGFKRAARDYGDKSGVILLDADNLARLAQRELSG